MNRARTLHPIFHAHAAFMAVVLALVLAGCQAGGPYAGLSIDTANKALVVADAEVRAGYLLLEKLAEDRTISAEDARSAKDALDDAREALRATQRAVAGNGDPSQVSGGVARAEVAIAVALGILAEYAD